ncbi:MAG: hypothetical protein JWO53_279 [Chlamydiia bacterium]|nr:hypothetical protein [Chlamydiia bacterium]
MRSWITLKSQIRELWNRLPTILKLPLAAVRQFPITYAVATLPFPYNISVPCVCAGWKTIKYQQSGGGLGSLIKYYFKSLSRTFFGLSMRRFIEHTAKYTLSTELGISEDAVQAIGIFMIVICVILDAFD